jgi:hypothetical protein
MGALASVVLFFMLGAQDAAPASIRIPDTRLASLLADGVRRSPTLQSLIDRIQDSQVIVFVQTVRWLPSELAGTVSWIGASGPYRFVRVMVKLQVGGDALVASLGHELHHVLEVTQAPWVLDDRSLLELYELIGQRTSGTGLAWDTIAAQSAGDQILRELKGQASGAAAADER